MTLIPYDRAWKCTTVRVDDCFLHAFRCSGKSPGYGVTLVAETTSGCLISAEACYTDPRSSSSKQVGESTAAR